MLFGDGLFSHHHPGLDPVRTAALVLFTTRPTDRALRGWGGSQIMVPGETLRSQRSQARRAVRPESPREPLGELEDW